MARIVHKRSKAEHKADALRALELLGRVTVPNAAAIMELHPYTVRDYIAKGWLAYVMIGKRPWITKEELARYQNEGKLQPQFITSPDEAEGYEGEPHWDALQQPRNSATREDITQPRLPFID